MRRWQASRGSWASSPTPIKAFLAAVAHSASLVLRRGWALEQAPQGVLESVAGAPPVMCLTMENLSRLASKTLGDCPSLPACVLPFAAVGMSGAILSRRLSVAACEGAPATTMAPSCRGSAHASATALASFVLPVPGGPLTSTNLWCAVR